MSHGLLREGETLELGLGGTLCCVTWRVFISQTPTGLEPEETSKAIRFPPTPEVDEETQHPVRGSDVPEVTQQMSG